MSKTHLFLFTNEYPCSKVLEHYIGHEITFLSKAFEKVIIFPSTPGTIEKKIPSNVEVVNIYDKRWFRPSKSDVLKCWPLFISTFLNEPFKKNIFRQFKTFYNAFVCGNAIMNYAELNNIDLKRTVFYSYWFYHAPLINAILKKREKISAFISRAHQADLYTEQFKGNEAFYNFKFREITKIALAGYPSQAYLSAKFPHYKDKFIVSHVSVSDHGVNPMPLNEVVVVSCSSYSERKRIDLLAELIAKCSLNIKWVHIGYVPPVVLNSYKEQFGTSDNFRNARFPGDISNEELMEFYKKNSVSVIVNISTSEGLPVSVVEATAFGIPCIVTRSNDTPDIATELNGFLLPVDFAPAEFYKCLDLVVEKGKELREGARKLFFRRYNANEVYPEFISLLKQ
jgi:colanic acid/amylovoran biosynthesis glycosyltransferase